MKKLGFGLMRLPLLDTDDPKKIDREAVCRMVDLFMEQGFGYFDTAYPYHEPANKKSSSKSNLAKENFAGGR